MNQEDQKTRPLTLTFALSLLCLMGLATALAGCGVAGDDGDDASSNGVDLSEKTIRLSITNKGSDDRCPLINVSAMHAGDGAGISLGFEPSLPLIEAGYSKEGDEVGVGEIGNFRVDVAPSTTSQDEVAFVPAAEAIPGRDGGYAYMLVSASTVAGSSADPATLMSTYNVELTSGTLSLTTFDPEGGNLSATFTGQATCKSLTASGEAVTIDVSGTITIE